MSQFIAKDAESIISDDAFSYRLLFIDMKSHCRSFYSNWFSITAFTVARMMFIEPSLQL